MSQNHSYPCATDCSGNGYCDLITGICICQGLFTGSNDIWDRSGQDCQVDLRGLYPLYAVGLAISFIAWLTTIWNLRRAYLRAWIPSHPQSPSNRIQPAASVLSNPNASQRIATGDTGNSPAQEAGVVGTYVINVIPQQPVTGSQVQPLSKKYIVEPERAAATTAIATANPERDTRNLLVDNPRSSIISPPLKSFSQFLSRFYAFSSLIAVQLFYFNFILTSCWFMFCIIKFADPGPDSSLGVGYPISIITGIGALSFSWSSLRLGHVNMRLAFSLYQLQRGALNAHFQNRMLLGIDILMRTAQVITCGPLIAITIMCTYPDNPRWKYIIWCTIIVSTTMGGLSSNVYLYITKILDKHRQQLRATSSPQNQPKHVSSEDGKGIATTTQPKTVGANQRREEELITVTDNLRRLAIAGRVAFVFTLILSIIPMASEYMMVRSSFFMAWLPISHGLTAMSRMKSVRL